MTVRTARLAAVLHTLPFLQMASVGAGQSTGLSLTSASVPPQSLSVDTRTEAYRQNAKTSHVALGGSASFLLVDRPA